MSRRLLALSVAIGLFLGAAAGGRSAQGPSLPGQGAPQPGAAPEPRPGDLVGSEVKDLGRRPLDAIEAEAQATRAEAQDLLRRTRILSEAQQGRKATLRQRLRVLYKLSQGGFGRLFLHADTPVEMYRRRNGARRVIARDLEELTALRDELAELSGEQEELKERLARVAELDRAAAHMRAGLQAGQRTLSGLAELRGALPRPVAPGGLLVPFGREVYDRGLELFRHGVELSADPGALVRAVAAGQVRYLGELPGLGPGVIVEHEGGYLTLYARIGQPMVVAGDTVSSRTPLGRAAYSRVYFQLSLGDLPVDPEPWFGDSPRRRREK